MIIPRLLLSPHFILYSIVIRIVLFPIELHILFAFFQVALQYHTICIYIYFNYI